MVSLASLKTGYCELVGVFSVSADSPILKIK